MAPFPPVGPNESRSVTSWLAKALAVRTSNDKSAAKPAQSIFSLNGPLPSWIYPLPAAPCKDRGPVQTTDEPDRPPEARFGTRGPMRSAHVEVGVHTGLVV